MNFLRGTAGLKQREQRNLDDLDWNERRDKCRELLEDLNAQNLTERGAELQHSCVLDRGMHSHGDRSPSASLNYEKLTYNCFTCGSGMGIIPFMVEVLGISRGAAFAWLMHGVESTTSSHREPPALEPQSHHALTELIPFMHRHPYPYLVDRGIPTENAIKHLVGFDSVTNRIVIPLFWEGELIGWQTRRIDDDDGTEKYLTSVGTKKGRILYNLDHNDNQSWLVLVESPLTVVAKSHLIDEGYRFISSLGANVSRDQLDLLAEYDEIILWLDNDLAGREHSWQVAERLTSRGLLVHIVQSPYAADPDELDDNTCLRLLEDSESYQAVSTDVDELGPTESQKVREPPVCSLDDCYRPVVRGGKCRYHLWLYGSHSPLSAMSKRDAVSFRKIGTVDAAGFAV